MLQLPGILPGSCYLNVGVVQFFFTNCCGRTMAGQEYCAVWQGIDFGFNAVPELCKIAAWQICPADAVPEDEVTAKNTPCGG